MRAAMLKLSEEHRNILSLFYLEGFSIAEIAHILQLSIGTVKYRLFYARESLKKKVKLIYHE
ncbi:MAG: RNA polymerase sigma-70 factor (ECF subfamily) [Saprospiraceae bacterium]|jgi:RNA polymerase sigma-70 factor (ECF subfamily)